MLKRTGCGTGQVRPPSPAAPGAGRRARTNGGTRSPTIRPRAGLFRTRRPLSPPRAGLNCTRRSLFPSHAGFIRTREEKRGSRLPLSRTPSPKRTKPAGRIGTSVRNIRGQWKDRVGRAGPWGTRLRQQRTAVGPGRSGREQIVPRPRRPRGRAAKPAKPDGGGSESRSRRGRKSPINCESGENYFYVN